MPGLIRWTRKICDNFKRVISEHMVLIMFIRTSEIVLIKMPHNAFDDKSTLV